MNWNSFALSGTLTWQGALLACPTRSGGTEYLNLTVSPSASQTVYLAANGGTQQFTLTLSNVPNYVAVGQLELKYDLPLTDGVSLGNNGTSGNFESWERVCLVDSTPVNLMQVPWTDFLEWPCRWAFGYAEPENVRRELTRGMHYSNRAPANRVRYDPTDVWYYEVSKSGSIPLELTSFVDSISTSLWTDLDCRDFAAILWLAFQWNGISARFDWLERWDGSQVPGEFWTWPLCKAGLDSRASGDRQTNLGNYVSFGFGFHCVIAESGDRFDAAASYLWDPSYLVWENPAWDWGVVPHWQNQTAYAWNGLAYGAVQAAYPFTSSQSLGWHMIFGLDPSSVR